MPPLWSVLCRFVDAASAAVGRRHDNRQPLFHGTILYQLSLLLKCAHVCLPCMCVRCQLACFVFIKFHSTSHP